MNDSTTKTSLEDLEPTVKLYQETKDSRYFDLIVRQCRGYIQGRAMKAAKQFGLNVEDCESTLMISLWKSVESYNPETGVAFGKYANVGFNKNLSWLFGKESRYNTFFGPYTKGDQYQEMSKVQMYYIDQKPLDKDMSDIEEWDLYDPRADVENLICEQDSARSLMEDIKKVDEVAGNVAGLVASGHDHRDVAIIMGYIPEGTSQRTAQLNWVSRRLKKCIPPTEGHYMLMGVPIPINLRS